MRWIVASLLMALGGCSPAKPFGCANDLRETKPDMDGQLIAYRYVRVCGATTQDTTQVAIGRRGESPGKAEIVLILAPGAEDGSDMEGKAVWSEMHWTAPHKLSVAYSDKARLVKSGKVALGASIQYRATSRLTLPQVD
jgi:hypothetical protein